MSKLFVITPVNNLKTFAGINHSNAVRNISGSAVFAFRDVNLAARVAQGIDDRIIHGKLPVLSEDLLNPFSHLEIGQDIELKYPKTIENKPLVNLNVGKVDESQLISFCSALQISCIILSNSTSANTMYVSEIISPERSLAFSAGYLSFLYEKDDDPEM